MKLNRNPLILMGLATLVVVAPFSNRVLAQEVQPAPVISPVLLKAQVGETVDKVVQPKSFQVGRATQGGSSYIGAGANIGALGGSS
ncbi:MAG: hypothetical protein WA902_05985, partial [Thermosynechococcaceae cyanobacterium]